jgi:alpha-galactosidase
MDAKNLKIAYIGGGSRSWARVFMTDLALEPELGGEIRLYDIDMQAAANNATIGNRVSEDARAVGKWRYSVADSLKTVLTDADFVVISILPGTFKEMSSDVHLPEQLGVYQSVGDTTGPGGIIRALRTIPIFAQFAEAIRSYAPQAWVINYTNPMAQCVRALYHFFPQIKAFGCCHEVFGTQELLVQILREQGFAEVARKDDIHVNVFGLNHFTWFDKASYRGRDLLELYGEFARQHYETGFATDTKHLPDEVFSCLHRVKFDLFLKYGAIAAAGDRHLAEFMPGKLYLENPATVREWGFYLTSVAWREEDLHNKLAKSERLLKGLETLELKSSGEEGVLLIKALCGLARVLSNVNLPNTLGQIANPEVPPATVVETNALFSHDDVRPIMAGRISEDIMALLSPHIANQGTVFEAAVQHDRALVYEAFTRDPLLAERASAAEIKKLADDMIENTLKFLPEGW